MQLKLQLDKDSLPDIVSVAAHDLSSSEVALHHTDVLYMGEGSYVYIEINVTNVSHFNTSCTWFICEESYFLFSFSLLISNLNFRNISYLTLAVKPCLD